MSRISKLLSTTLLVMIIDASPAICENLRILKSSDSISHHYSQDWPDIAGIRLGLSIDEARNALKMTYKGSQPKESSTSLTLQVGNVSVKSEPYVEIVTSEKDNYKDAIRLTFSAPTIGSRVVGIEHTSDFVADRGPSVSELQQRFVSVLGKPSSSPIHTDAEHTTLSWVFNSVAPISCPSRACDMGDATTDLNSIGERSTMLSQGIHVAITVIIVSSMTKKDVAERMTVFINDNANELLSLTEARKQLEAFGSSAPP